MADACFSDDSDFYGSAAEVRKLETRVQEADIKAYWETRARDINILHPKQYVESQVNPPARKGGMHNRWEGRESAWQSHETVDEFLTRLPVSGSSWVGPWIWVANPYSDRDAEPEFRHTEFVDRGQNLLDDYLNTKRQMTEDNPSTTQGVITRKLKPARDKLKDDILALARSFGMLSGKWMLFPSEEDAPSVWKTVVKAVLEDRLGVGAKIATEANDGKASRLICIYTKDFGDSGDVKRVVAEIKRLGLLPTNGWSIYYKCDAYTYLDIMSGNEYGLQASLYSSKDILESKPAAISESAAPAKSQKRFADFSTQSKAAGKKRRT